MKRKNEPPPGGNVANVQGSNVVGSAIGAGNTVTSRDITVHEQNLKQTQNALPPELATALADALRGIQASDLSGPLKVEAVSDHAKLTDELKKPKAEHEPTLLKKFWNGLWSVADKVPAVVKLYEALQKHLPGL